ncbi:MAG: hypothetical protein QM783_20495 [Phycisphaerales bacterium]
MCSVAQIIEHRLARESLVKRLEPASGTALRTRYGTFNVVAYESVVDPLPHVALTLGGVGDLDAHGRPLEQDKPTLVRMHRRTLLGDVFEQLSGEGSGPSGHDQLAASMQAIQREGAAPSSTCALRAAGRAARRSIVRSSRGSSRSGAGVMARARIPISPTSLLITPATRCRRTCASSASAGRSCATWGSASSACSPTTPPNSPALKRSGSKSSSV